MSPGRFGFRPAVVAAGVLLALALGCAALAAAPLTVTNVFDNTFVIDALRDISAQTGVPIIADSTVQGQATLTLENVPLEEALARVLATGGYVFRDMGGYYLVGAPDTKNPSFALLSVTETVKLRYAKAETAKGLLAEAFDQYVKVDKDTHSLVVTAPETIMKRIKSDLAAIDQVIPQIMIEAMVVDISKEGRKELGLDWSLEHAGKKSSSDDASGLLQVVGLATGLEYTTAGGLTNFLLSLKSVVGKGEARVEANPRVATLDGQAAEIFVGRDRYYYLTDSDSDSTSTGTTTRLEAIKTGITLKILPQVAENGDITVRIEPEVSDVVSDTNGNDDLPVISRRKVSTTVRVKEGDSIVLGGLLQRLDHKVVNRVPVLGYLPILGFFFSSTKTVQEEGEVLIIITPYLVDQQNTGLTPRLTAPKETGSK